MSVMTTTSRLMAFHRASIWGSLSTPGAVSERSTLQPFAGKSMTDESRTHSRRGTPPTTRGLSAQQRSVMQIMREHQFGRIENMSIRSGQPIIDRDVNVVRVAHLGGERGGTRFPSGDEFELKQAVCDLFDELARL